MSMARPRRPRFLRLRERGGGGHTCGVRSNGSVACWGGNWGGRSTPPAGSFVSVSAGDHTCGVRSDGSVACWGRQARGLTASDFSR